jgi:glycosyltransferase involved in cell wall biosynthesis
MLDARIYNREAKTLQAAGYQVLHIGYGNEDKHYFTEDGIEIIQLKKIKKGNSLKTAFKSFNQSFLANIFEVAANTKADVYHLHDVELCRIVRKLKKLSHKPKVIYDAHEAYLENFLDFRKYASKTKMLFIDIPALIAERRAIKHLDFLIAPVNFIISKLTKETKKTALIHNYSYFEPKELNAQSKKYDLIYSGTISEIRGLELVIEAIKECKNNGHIVSFVIVGSFNSAEHELAVKQLIDDYGLKNQIHFTGHIPFDDVEDYYKQSKIGTCILPFNKSFNIGEPVKVFEYLLCGLPVILSNYGVMKEIAEADNIGFAVDPHNAKDIADKIQYLLSENRYESYFQRCVTVGKAKYAWKNEGVKLLSIYKSLLQ